MSMTRLDGTLLEEHSRGGAQPCPLTRPLQNCMLQPWSVHVLEIWKQAASSDASEPKIWKRRKFHHQRWWSSKKTKGIALIKGSGHFQEASDNLLDCQSFKFPKAPIWAHIRQWRTLQLDYHLIFVLWYYHLRFYLLEFKRRTLSKREEKLRGEGGYK